MCLSIPAKIEKIEGETALCSVGGASYQANLMMLDVEALKPGDYVLIHTGFAIQKLDRDEAEASLKAFREFKNLNEEMDREEEETNQRLI